MVKDGLKVGVGLGVKTSTKGLHPRQLVLDDTALMRKLGGSSAQQSDSFVERCRVVGAADMSSRVKYGTTYKW